MKKLFAALLLLTAANSTLAGDGIVIDSAWVREAPPGAQMMAAYMLISNRTDSDIELMSVTSTAFNHIMIHRSKTVDGVARMQHVDSIRIPAHGSVALEPGGYHLMMPSPESRLVSGNTVEIELHFSNQASKTITAVVRKKP